MGKKLPKLCVKHPKYTAKLAPRGDCDACWIAYNFAMLERIKEREHNRD